MTNLTERQNEVLEHARRNGGRVYAADFARPNAQGRAATARAAASFYRTVNALVRRGLLRQLRHPRWSVQGWELVVEQPTQATTPQA
jgi:hypothetical protein